MFLEIRGDFLKQLIESLKTEVDQKDEGMIENAVFIYLEDVF
jgi:hypothetical protein